MGVTQIDGGRLIKVGSITLDRLVEGVIQADGGQAFTADQSFGGHKATSIADATADTDVPSWGQVKNVVTAKDWKDPVDVATLVNGALSTAYANGQVVDGVTLVTGMRILLKNQTTGAENGIYDVPASGTPTRSADADSNNDVTHNMTLNVLSGTQAGLQWTLTTADPITLGTTALTFANTGSSSPVVAGAGLTKTGNTVDAIATDASILVNANDFGVQKADASLEVVGGGLRVKAGTSGQVYIASAGGVLTPVTLSGDATVSAAGVLTLAATVLKASSYVPRETPTGTVNGVNPTFTLAFTPIAGTESVFVQGIMMEPGAGNDYTISGAVITMLTTSIPATGERLRVSYFK